MSYLFAVCIGIYIERYYRFRIQRNMDYLIQAFDGRLFQSQFTEVDPWNEWISHLKDLAEQEGEDIVYTPDPAKKEVEMTKTNADPAKDECGRECEQKSWYNLW